LHLYLDQKSQAYLGLRDPLVPDLLRREEKSALGDRMVHIFWLDAEQVGWVIACLEVAGLVTGWLPSSYHHGIPLELTGCRRLLVR
jgi:hypothetical protein